MGVAATFGEAMLKPARRRFAAARQRHFVLTVKDATRRAP